MGIFSKVGEIIEEDRREQEAIAAANASLEQAEQAIAESEQVGQSETAPTNHVETTDNQVATVEDQLKLIARKVRAAHKRIQKAAAAAVLGVVEMGEQLRIAKQLLAGHKGGSFGKWLKDCGIPRSSAHRAVQVFETLGDCSTVGQLDLSAAYALSASGTPETAIAEVIEITNTERVDAKQVRTIIAKHKPARNKTAAPAPIVIRVGGATVSIVSNGRTDFAAVLLEAAEQLDRDQAAA